MKKWLLIGILIFLIGFVSADCVVPYNGMVITENTTFCQGEYSLSKGISIGANDVVLDCNGAVLNGNSTVKGIYSDSKTSIKIRNCLINNFLYGIYLKNISYSSLINNTVNNNSGTYCYFGNGWSYCGPNDDSGYGIYLDTSKENNLVDNVANGNKDGGIFLYNSDSNILNSNIAINTHSPIGNTLYRNRAGIMLGWNSSNNKLLNNIANNNGKYGILLDTDSNNNLLVNNVAENNYIWGFVLHQNRYNTLIENRGANNRIGIQIENWGWEDMQPNFDSNNNYINRNIFENNDYGLRIYNTQNFNSSNVIKGNTIKNNKKDGIDVYYESNNTLSENIITGNNVGIYLYWAGNNKIFNNNIFSNEIYNLKNEESEDVIIKYNWWGINNMSEIFSKIYGNVTFLPFLCEPYPTNFISNENGECIFDEDNDGIPNNEDKCPNTVGQQIVYGCSCEQILELKPGEDIGLEENNCSKGTIEVFTKEIGWAKDLF